MKSGKKIVKKLTQAYWPNPEKNEPANHDTGDPAVDALTLGELKLFFDTVNAGPTYCLVKERFETQLRSHFQDHLTKAAREADRAMRRFANEVQRTSESLNDFLSIED